MSTMPSNLRDATNRRNARSRDLHARLASPFGEDWYGRYAEDFTRLIGKPVFLVGQTVVVLIWLAFNLVAAGLRWDPYPFILLNLVFSLEAAYAAPLILLAQTRQADRDKEALVEDARHRDALAQESLERQELAAAQAEQLRTLLESNAVQTDQLRTLLESNAAQTDQLRALLESNTALTEETRRLAGQLELLAREIYVQVRAENPGSSPQGGSPAARGASG
jgi:uncharacterized membrane protein